MAISLNPEHWERYKDIALLLIKYGRTDLVKQTGLTQTLSEVKIDRETEAEIKELPDDLEKLGPTYIKLGQFLSTRSDLLPPPYLDALSRLQENVKPFSFAEVEHIISSELGIRFSKAFKDFDTEPIGSASIGQVHKAVMPNGKPVVVKIQRPGIRDKAITDLDALGELADLLTEYTDFGKDYDVKGIFEEFRKGMLREMDYRNEVQNLKTIAKNVSEFKNIIVPLPIEDYYSSKVITMDYIRGNSFTNVSPLKMLEVDGDKLAADLFEAYLKQIIIDGIYHSDPHPGNIYITNDNKIALLDLGMVGYVSGEMQKRLLEILIALGDGRGDDVASYMEEIARKDRDFDLRNFRSTISEFVATQKSTTLENLEIGSVILELTRLCAVNGVHIPNELTMLGKTLLNLDKVGKTLSPNFNPNLEIRRKADELLKKKFMNDAQSKKPYEILLEGKEFFERLPGRINKIFDKVANNDIRVKVDAIDETYLMNGFQKVANRITLGLIIASMIIGAALIMNIRTGFTIFGYPGIAIVLFIFAAATGISLAIKITFTDEVMHKKDD